MKFLLIAFAILAAILLLRGQGGFVLVITLATVIGCLIKVALRRRGAEDHYPKGHF